MSRRILLTLSVAIATMQLVPVAATAQSEPVAHEHSVSVPRGVLERYAGRYELNGAEVAVTVTVDGKLSVQLVGQPPVPPMRALSQAEFVNDAVGVRVWFDADGPNASRIISFYNGQETVGTRIVDVPDGAAMPGSASSPLDRAARQAVVREFSIALRDRYVFPQVGELAAAAIETALATGTYDDLADPTVFAARLSVDVNAIAHDKHLTVRSLSTPPPPPPGAGLAMARSEGGVVRADRLAGGIGYIEVLAFPRPLGFKPAIDPAMQSLAGSSALIIDLRRNIGGAPEGVNYLASFLLPPEQPVHINDIVARIPGTQDFTRERFTSHPTPVNFAGRPVYILTSSNTFSGGEAFAYDVRALGLAETVGELTAGGGNLTGPAMLGNGLVAMIPFARSENAVTMGNWEGVGVEPDIATPAADALGAVLAMLGQNSVSDIDAASYQRVFTPRSNPLPGTQTALRSVLVGMLKDPPDLSAMAPEQAAVLRQQLPQLLAQLRPLGALTTIAFREPGLPAGDAFDVTFTNGALTFTAIPDAEGLLIGLQMGPSSYDR